MRRDCPDVTRTKQRFTLPTIFHDVRSRRPNCLSIARCCDISPSGYPQWMVPENCDPMNYLSHFETRQDVCGGETVVRGTRVTLRTLLASLAEGDTVDEILADFPTVSAEDLQAVIAFAAASAEEDLPIPPMPKVA